MTAVDDLATWLTQIWDDEERGENSKYTMRSDTPTPLEWSHGFGDLMDVRIGDSPFEERMPASEFRERFMAPSPDQKALARIAADRKILALHAPTSDGECRTCCGEPYMEEHWDSETETETVVWKRADLAWPCPTVRLKAEMYAVRPGYREEWMVG